MTAIDYSRNDPFAFTHPSVARRVANWASTAFRAWQNRRAFYRLGELTDVELHDIGLTRGDLAVVSDASLTYDPTLHISRIARQRINRMELGERA